MNIQFKPYLMSKTEIIEILNEWNYWNKDLPQTNKIDFYDKKYRLLSNIMRVPNLQTRGDDLETTVCLELIRRGYTVYYYKTSNNLECDFIVEYENKIRQLIQVTKSLSDEKNKKKRTKGVFKNNK